MQYELYIDVLFLINFMMDYIVLSLVHYILKSNVNRLYIVLASVIGAGLTCMIIVIGINNVIFQFLLFHIIINTVMITIGLKLKDFKDIVKALLILYISSILLGGTLEMISQYLPIGSLFFALVIFSYYMVKGIWFYIHYFITDKEKWYDVELTIEELTFSVKALLDTGNGLRDPISKKPVHILNGSTASRFIERIDKSMLRYIPYQTVGNSGVLPAIVATKIHVQGDKNVLVYEPIIALSKENISASSGYEMILNSDIL